MITGQLIALLKTYLPKGKQIGEEFVSPCPFHKGGQERRPSFSLNMEQGVSFCHTCHKGWSLKTLLRELGVPQLEADRVVGRFPKRVTPKSIFRDTDLFKGFEIPELVLVEFDRCPLELLIKGFKKETLKYFEVGYDLERDRITYPIRNVWGTLVGIYGRLSDEEKEILGLKYKPYQEEFQEAVPGYKIGGRQHLWNLHHLYPIAWKVGLGEVIVVEGFKQAMWVWQAGFYNVLALFGSYMTRTQQALIQRIGSNIILFLDNDGAGKEGTLRTAGILRGLQKVKICTYPEKCNQPDDMDSQMVRSCIEGASDLRTWRRNNVL